MKIFYRITVVIVLQILVLIGIIGLRQWTLDIGTKTTLETQPIDPRSLFSGDYVRLNYKISALPFPASMMTNLKKNQEVYVTLVPGDPFWTAESVSVRKVTVQPPKIMVKARVTGISMDKVFLHYGIENFFIPEGEGKQLERPAPKDVISVKVAVDRFGNAAIEGILLNQKEIYQEKLF